MPPLLDPTDAELKASVHAAMRQMASGKFVPSMNDWNASRPPGLPSKTWISTAWGWAATVEAAGLQVQQPKRNGNRAGCENALDFNEPLTEYERHACATRGLYERGW